MEWKDGKIGFWWLVALEATLFAFLPYWELTAPWAEPITAPWAFAATVVTAATAAMLAFHCGPAFFGRSLRAGRIPFGNWVVAWLSLGFVDRFWLGVIEGRYAAASAYIGWVIPGQQAIPNHFWLLPFIVAPLAIALSFRSWWKPVVILQLALGGGFLVWALATAWPGIWIVNPRYNGPPEQFEDRIFEGVLLSAAPALVIGWAAGRRASNAREVWWSGFAGVWLPIVLTLTIGSIACEAGAERFWVPSLFRGFNWAMLGSEGKSLESSMKWASWTVFAPLLLYTISLRLLAVEWRGGTIYFAGILAAASLVCIYFPWKLFEYHNLFAAPPFAIWAWSVAALGTVAGVIALRTAQRKW